MKSITFDTCFKILFQKFQPLLQVQAFITQVQAFITRTNNMNLVVRKPAFSYAKTKTQISCAVTVQLISAFVFATCIVQPFFYLNPKFQSSSQAIFCGSTARFVSDLVGNPEYRFSHNEAHISPSSFVNLKSILTLTN